MVFKKQTTKEIVEQLLNEKLTEEDYALIKDIAEQEIPRFPTDEDLLSSVIAVDGIPVIDSSRKEKLIGILAKKFSCPEGSKVSNAAKFQVTKDSIEIPLDEEGNSKGFCFVDFGSPADAEKALRLLNGRHLDSKHIFRTFKLSSLDNYSKINDEFVPPPEPEFQETGDYQSWLLDKHCNDQFVMFHDRMTSVMWNTKTGAQPCIERDHWAEQYVAWSPKGSFLATVHQQGVALWGGEYWKKIQRFEHSGVQLLDFSPCEKYIVTCNNEIVDDRDNPRAIIIWDIRTGAKLRCFQKAGKEFSWPVFKWSHDDKYVARPGDDYIAIYETPSMKTLVKGEKKTILVEGLRDASFSWSPTVRHLAFWVPEKDPHPARVALLEIPSKQIVRSKNLFNIEHATMHWHENGYYLCVKVDSKSKKGKEFSSFEIFRVKEKSIPVDTLETNEPVYAFSWEPNGHRFVVIHGHQKNSLNVTVYTMKGRQSGIDQVTRLFLIELRPFRTVVWSPKGSRFVLANLYGANRSLEFWDADSATRLNQGEHYLASRVEWDPTGRYVATYVSAWSEPTEHGYYLWTSQGRLLHRVPVPKLCQFAWRPRPKDDLSPEELKLVEKKAREWASRFDKEDREIEGKVTENERKWRRAQLAQWRTALAKVEAAKTALRESWGRVEPPPQVTQDWIEIEDEDEELLERKVFA